MYKRIPAGVIDSGFASIATFAVGVFAVRYLTASGLGIYSVYFSAFVLATVIPRNLIFKAAQVNLLPFPMKSRLGAFRNGLLPGSFIALLSASLVSMAIPTATTTGQGTLVVPMTVTAFLAAFLSPIQDHLRTIMHLGEASWGAAAMSIVQGTVVGAVLVTAGIMNLDPAWIPFGALMVANTISLIVGFVLLERIGDDPDTDSPSLGTLVRPGGWFLATEITKSAAEFVSRSIVLFVASPAVLGFVEGARLASRPLAVFVVGISAVVVPKSMEAGRTKDQTSAALLSKRFNGGVLVLGLVYLLVGGVSWPGNPMVELVPLGYTVSWLVPSMIIATAFQSTLFTKPGEIIGAGLERNLTRVEALGSTVFVLSSFLAGLIGAFSIPIAVTLTSAVRWIGYRRTLQEHYSGE